MNGPGITPPPTSDGTRTGLRVLFVLLAVVSCGFLAWAPLLRVALLRRNVADWVICAASGVLTITLFGLIGNEPGDTAGPRSNAALSVLLIQAVVSAAYFLVVDIRYYRELDARMPQRPYGQQPFPYGVQQQQTQLPTPRADYNPYRDTPTPGPAQPVAPAPDPAATPAPGPAGPAAPRIDQVRAELDELSDYLRKEEGR